MEKKSKAVTVRVVDIVLVVLVLMLTGTNVWTIVRLMDARETVELAQNRHVEALVRVDSSLTVAHAQLDSLLAGGKDSVIIHHRRVVERIRETFVGIKPAAGPDSLVNSLNRILQ